MIDKAHLQGKAIAVRISSLDRAVSATVSYVEQDGIWFVGSEVVGQVTTNGGGMPLGLKTPAVRFRRYVGWQPRTSSYQVLWVLNNFRLFSNTCFASLRSGITSNSSIRSWQNSSNATLSVRK